jgi:hypothetical protein
MSGSATAGACAVTTKSGAPVPLQWDEVEDHEIGGSAGRDRIEARRHERRMPSIGEDCSEEIEDDLVVVEDHDRGHSCAS